MISYLISRVYRGLYLIRVVYMLSYLISRVFRGLYLIRVV